jgi:CO/xanthine dehydrogenase Mo-binding subunit
MDSSCSRRYVTAYTGKCDFGQGTFTVQTQLVAEELCVSLDPVKLIQCDTLIAPDQETASGSQSTPTNFNSDNLAQAAATAREALINHRGEPVRGAGRSTHAGRCSHYREIRTPHHVRGAHWKQAIQSSAKQNGYATVSFPMENPGKSLFERWMQLRS